MANRDGMQGIVKGVHAVSTFDDDDDDEDNGLTLLSMATLLGAGEGKLHTFVDFFRMPSN